MILDEPPKLMSFWADICWTVVNTIYTIHFKNNIRENSIFEIHTLFKSSICALCVQYRIIFPNNGSIWSIQGLYDQSGIHVVNIGQMWLIWGSEPGIILNLLKTAPVCSVQGAGLGTWFRVWGFWFFTIFGSTPRNNAIACQHSKTFKTVSNGYICL